jgi:hypothetical protein
MRRYLLDTPLLTAYLYGRRGATELISPWIANREVGTSILVYGEIIEHLKGRADFSTLHVQLRALLREVSPMVLTFPILERYADVRRQFAPRTGLGSSGTSTP